MSLHLCSTFFLTPFPCSSLGSLPWDTVFHKLPQWRPFPWAAVLEKLLQHESFVRKGLLQHEFPVQVTGLARKPALVWAPLHRQTLLRACSCMGCPWDAASFGACGHLLQRGSPLATRSPPVSPWSSLWAAGESLLQFMEHLFLLFCCVEGHFSNSFSAAAQCFSPFLNILSQRWHTCGWWAQLWALVG